MSKSTYSPSRRTNVGTEEGSGRAAWTFHCPYHALSGLGAPSGRMF